MLLKKVTRSLSPRTVRRRQKGYVLFTMAATSIVICAFAGLVVDLGYAEFVRREAQTAADAGAKSAAFQIKNGHTDSIAAAAKQDTANNGFTDGSGGVTVTMNHPPLTGNYTGNNSYVEVIVTKSLSTSFMSIVGAPTVNISTRGVGGSGGGGCVYALDPTAQDAIIASGSASLSTGCGIVDESDNSKGLETSGGACMTGSSIQVVGNYNGSCISPSPTTGITSPGDPLAGKYIAPTPGGCDYTNWHNAGTTISQGTYCGGITISSSGTTVTASAGRYILLGGGLTVSGGANLAGSGVTFYNTYNGTYSYKPFVISGGSATQLSAPTSGAYEGLLFWQDPALPSNQWNQQNTVSGGSATQFQGIIYLPNTPLVYSGGSSNSAAYTVIVADKITFSGPSVLNDDYSSLSSGNPVKTTAIVAE
jgi:hypothetical protein